MKIITAYRCNRFVVEWYYNEAGKSPSLEYFKTLNPRIKEKLLRLFIILDINGKIVDIRKFRYEGNHIFFI